ncbi:MAG: hypothetical protein JOZ86_15530 [Candidatus Eremiobacteraeota bacterium]|nr:hypothetical protein [Candidatus Eremiobacteraeota bacterium]
MRVDQLVPDAAPPSVNVTPLPIPGAATDGGANAFARLVDAAGAILDRADLAEAAFAAHRGGLQEMVVERARADIALQVAATASQRAAQGLATLLGMQL